MSTAGQAGPQLVCPACGSPDVDLRRGLLCGTCAAAVAEEASTEAFASVSTHWAVAWGSENLNDGVGYVELYDDEEDAREHVPFYKGGSVVKRTVIALPWEPVPGEEATP